jgi:uncharacterized membrane protein
LVQPTGIKKSWQEDIRMKKENIKTAYMVKLAILTAVVLLMAFTPLGYLRLSVVEISFLALPVAVGAILLGPGAGAFLGGVFGATSFFQCFGISPFGGVLLGLNPVLTLILCMVPRILMGLLSGLVFRWIYPMDRGKTICFALASLSAAAFNTLFSMLGLVLFFGGTDFVRGMQGTTPLLSFVISMIGAQGMIEAVVCCVVGGAVCKAASWQQRTVVSFAEGK